MFFIDFYVKGYKGFMAKLGLNEIYIDFRKCTHKIVSIQGGNGCGKSTLVDILHPFCDNNNYFMENEIAVKKAILNCNGIIYEFEIISSPKSSGRENKAYIRKFIDGNYSEMNPNGNVTSYNDYIYSEFNLDINYILLSKLSISNKGLVEKTPTERKKYISALLAEVEAYNGFLKILSKRASNVNSVMKNISRKLNSIGDIKSLQLGLDSANNRLIRLNNDKDMIISEISKERSKIEILDPDNSIQSLYNEISSSISILNKEIKSLESNINDILKKNKLEKLDDYSKEIENMNHDIILATEKINSIDIENKSILELRNVVGEQANELLLETDDKLEFKIESTFENIQEYEKEISEYRSMINSLQLSEQDIRSFDENTFKQLTESLKYIEKAISEISISDNVYNILKILLIKETIEETINTKEKVLNKCKNNLNDYIYQRTKYETLLQEAEKLKQRDQNCKSTNCLFIKSALEAEKQKPQENYDKYNKLVESKINDISKLEKEIQDYKDALSIYEKINNLLLYCKSILSLINKFPIIKDKEIFSNYFKLLDAIYHKSIDINSLENIIYFSDCANVFDLYKIKEEQLEDVYKLYKSYLESQEKNKIMTEKYLKLSNKIKEYNDKLDSNNQKKKEYNDILYKCNNLIPIYNSLNDINQQLIERVNKKKEYIDKYDTIKSNMVKIGDSLNKINQLNIKLDNIQKEIIPVTKDKDEIQLSLNMSKEAEEEFNIFKLRYNKINVLKNYCNPSHKEAIQLLFVEIYFQKTISICNDLLMHIFKGQYQLGMPDMRNFSIPVSGNTIPIDDVNSMSESQRCTMGIVLSLSLLYQSSTLWNIPKFDEIDEPYDTETRREFGSFMDYIIYIMGIQQLFYVSHNSEVSLNNADIILLTDKPNDLEKFNQYNIIYSTI